MRQIGGGRGNKVTVLMKFSFYCRQTKLRKKKRMHEVGKEGRKKRREVKKKRKRTGSANSLWLVLDASHDSEWHWVSGIWSLKLSSEWQEGVSHEEPTNSKAPSERASLVLKNWKEPAWLRCCQGARQLPDPTDCKACKKFKLKFWSWGLIESNIF